MPNPSSPPPLPSLLSLILPLLASSSPSYPPYCSTPGQISQRAIPPLPPSTPTSSQLIHVTTIIRHGARTPCRPIDCWDGYHPTSWDCSLTTLHGPLGSTSTPPSEFQFEKVYDGTTNALNGTCQEGQLLSRGARQLHANGRLLRDAYVFKTDDDPGTAAAAQQRTKRRTSLFVTDSRWSDDEIYFRVDDMPRTLMSGEFLLEGFLGGDGSGANERLRKITAHVADMATEDMFPNAKVCPRLNELKLAAEDENGVYVTYNTSEEVMALKGRLKEEYGRDFSYDAVDCLMTQVCEDRPVPKDLMYNEGKEDSLFRQLYAFTTIRSNFKLTFDDAAFSKLAMKGLWREIMENIDGLLIPKSQSSVPKFALFSGHDSTLMPLLATLGERVWNTALGPDNPDPMARYWVPYASMIVIEIHRIGEPTKEESQSFPTGHGFRLIYNGMPLHQLIPNCPQGRDESSPPPLCDVGVLLDHISPILDPELQQCDVTNEQLSSAASMMTTEMELLNTRSGVGLLVLWGAICASLGSMLMYIVMKRKGRGQGKIFEMTENQRMVLGQAHEEAEGNFV